MLKKEEKRRENPGQKSQATRGFRMCGFFFFMKDARVLPLYARVYEYMNEGREVGDQGSGREDREIEKSSRKYLPSGWDWH